MITSHTMHTPEAQATNVAIVGAGPGGLAAGVLLAASGLDVQVYEAAPEIGGRSAKKRVGDFAFDTGPTFFLMPAVLEEIFHAAGKRLSDYVELTPLDPMYRLVVGQKGREPITIDATRDIAEMSRRLAAINPSDGAAFARFINDNRAKLLAAEPILRKPIRSVLDLMDGESLRALPHIKPHLTVHQLLSKYFSHPAVQLAVSFQSKYLGMSPYECPSLFTILPFIEYEYGIWHPKGGCNALMRAMASVIRELGGSITTNAPVDEIVFDGHQATGVRIDGDTRHHDHVVVNADASWAIKNLIPGELRRGALSDRSIDSKRYSCSTFMMYLGVDGEINLPHHTIYISEDYRQNLDDISQNRGLSEDPSIYACNASVTDPTLAPEGKSSLYVLMPTPNMKADIDWNASQKTLERRCLEQLRTRMGIGNIEDRILEKEILSPLDWQAQNINFGATFNLAHNLGQMLHKRPHHRLQGFDNLWLVGGGTHPGSGLPVIFLSSQITSKLLCRESGTPFAGEGVPIRTREVGWSARPAPRPSEQPGGAPIPA